MEGGRSDPEIVVEVLRRIAFGGQVSGLGQLAVAPGADFLEIADLAGLDEFADFLEVVAGVALGADLSGDLALAFEIGGAGDLGFLDGVGEGLFAINVQAALHRPDGDVGVGVVGGGADDAVEVLLLEELPA